MPEIASRFADMKLFKSKRQSDGDDKGESIDDHSTGNRFYDVEATQANLRISSALRSFLVHNQVLSENNAGPDSNQITDALSELITKPHIKLPSDLIDRSHPLPEYFISSSHNTYLLAHQLYGTSCATAYDTAIKTGSRCVEIDAWDNSENLDEPKVTHGYTLVSNIAFRVVCETIRDVFDQEVAAVKTVSGGHAPSPILLSLENHCGAHGQNRLVQIMKEVFGDRLLSKPVRDPGEDEEKRSGGHVTLAELGARIVVIVEHHLPTEIESSDSESGSDSDSDSTSSSDSDSDHEVKKQDRKKYKENKKKGKATSSIIIPQLAELGVYAQSVKPSDNSWYNPGVLVNGPHHHLINVSETGLSAHLPINAPAIARHNSRHLMRVFPKGTRISSSNLRPIKFWALGAQICALNWQTFGLSNQLNDALFAGTDGYVLKPPGLRAGGDGKLGSGRKKRLRLHVAGATNIPLHDKSEADSIRPYLSCTLYHPNDSADTGPAKRKTSAYKQNTNKVMGFFKGGESSPPTDPVWDEELKWEYEDNELVFLRLLIKSDESWAKNPMFAALAVRLSYVVPGWSFLRMLDMKGSPTGCSLLVKFDIEDV